MHSNRELRLPLSGTNLMPRLQDESISAIHRFALLAFIAIALHVTTGQLEAAEQDPVGPTPQKPAPAALQQTIEDLPISSAPRRPSTDYLIDASPYTATITRSADRKNLVLGNGLIERVWRLSPNGACVAFNNLMTDQSMLRSIRPESRLTIDGKQLDVGGLVGQPNHAFLLPAWLEKMESDPNAMRLVGLKIGKPAERIAWGRSRRTAPNAEWPPAGAYLRMDYELAVAPDNEQAKDTPGVSVHYELYDGVPVMSKWVTVHNRGEQPITIDRYSSEELALVEHSNSIETRAGAPLPRPDYLHVETDFAFGGFSSSPANRHVVRWRTDPTYKTQVNYLLQTPCLLVCEPTYGPAQRIEPGEHFEGFRVYELVYDDGNRERRALAYRRMYRTIAPWVTENPITHHLLTNKPKLAREAIDKAADVGFEAIIFSFGSGFNMENRDSDFLEQWKRVADYARKKNIELGSYSLLSSRGVAKEHMLVPPEGETATHGRMPALTSEWGQEWIATVRDFYAKTGFTQFENDGPYPGDVDVTPRPPLQHGVNDSRWAQWRQNNRLYHGLRADGVYINQPDFHYLNGGNKSSMGYREVNWSLPRAQQVIHTRQNIYDGTWLKTPSMGWMHVPLAEYHGGGAAATIEPLHEHIDHYRQMLLSNLGMGVQAHYRGPRIYDTEQTRDMVKRTVDWFKQYRDILESDVIHGRRADGRDLDWVLHVNPQLTNKGMLCAYNPLPIAVEKTLRVNVYYTGLEDRTELLDAEGNKTVLPINHKHTIEVHVTIPPRDMVWYVMRSATPSVIRFSNKRSVADRRPLVIAHRGGVVSPHSPECSTTAIRLAAEMGYDMVELDVRRSRDGQPIVFHDRTLMEACDKPGSVSDFTATELATIRYRKGTDHIARLDTALRSCRRLGMGVMLDLKDGRNSQEFLELIDRLIVQHDLGDSSISFSGSEAARKYLRHVRFTPTDEELRRLRGGEALRLDTRFWFGIPQWLQDGDLQKLKSAGAMVIPAINTFRYPGGSHFDRAKADIERLLAEGVDGFQIDSIYQPFLD